MNAGGRVGSFMMQINFMLIKKKRKAKQVGQIPTKYQETAKQFDLFAYLSISVMLIVSIMGLN